MTVRSVCRFLTSTSRAGGRGGRLGTARQWSRAMHTRLPRILTRVVAGGMAGDAEEGSTTYRVYGGSIFKRVANGVLDRQPHRMTVKDATRRSPPPHLSRPLCITLDLPRPQWGNTPAKCNVRVQRVGTSESWLPARVLVLGLSSNFCDWSSNELDFTLRLFFYVKLNDIRRKFVDIISSSLCQNHECCFPIFFY